MSEVWKNIVGYEGLYEVSNLGKVRSIDRYVNHPKGGLALKKGRILQPRQNHQGYYCVLLSKDCKTENRRIHRLVAEAFIPNPNNLPQINHKDEDKSNNSVTNLEWCTCSYNIKYGSAIQRMINTKIKKGIYDKTHIGLSLKEQNRLNNIKYRSRKTQS